MEKRELTCIGCPMGCQITVELDGNEVKSVQGNSCAIGDKYARNEVVNPERTVTSTVVVLKGDKTRVSVKTKNNIPKSKIFDCMKEIDAVRIEAPVKIGDVIIENVCNTGVDVVATRNIELCEATK
ncbi:DUF1667 domain-containing protein [Lachnobacterium bovis]|uniref:DUF1667 domain-containing protein n=1 Tax=Lachnobacterium bovis TaxID=140626 RepID=UPI0003B3F71A|nr:DUF1667 domain-containing protein [Lachnobacterium bovis]